MFSASSSLMAAQETVSRSTSRHGYEAPEARAAMQLYDRTRLRARLGELWSALTGRPNRPLSLDTAAGAGRGRFSGGLRTIGLDQVRGSEGRVNDFDRAFRPLGEGTRGRWLSIARAHLTGAALPPIQVVQAGGVYYVRDGHHRVSVARALGQAAIEAEVTVWDA